VRVALERQGRTGFVRRVTAGEQPVLTLTEYQRELAQLPFGKRLPTAVYVYRLENPGFGGPLDRLVRQVAAVFQISEDFNVIKFRVDELKVSFLSYPEFFDDPHPSLHRSVTVDLVGGKARTMDYSGNPNPPILHRKETFLPKEHPRWNEFHTLTEAEEAEGLYEHTATIGFKLNWERLLQGKGISIIGHTLVRRGLSASESRFGAVSFVERHKTAMTRYELSKPVKTLLEYGLLKPGNSFFDYGCGQGADVRGLQGLGYCAEGWDPVFRPDVAKKTADVVNLGYVLNVIEDPVERLEALVEAFRHTGRVLVVAALIHETVETERSARFRDGVLTRRNTFQKFFEQHELQHYIEDALDGSAVPVALGIFYVFREPAEQQDFLSARSRRSIDWSQISARLGLGAPATSQWERFYREHRELLEEFGNVALALGRFPQCGEFPREQELVAKLGSGKRALRAFVLGSKIEGRDWPRIAEQFGIGQAPKARWEVVYEQSKELLDAFWEKMLQLGRLPAPEEFARFDEITEKIGSAKKALRLFLRRGGENDLKRAAEGRRNDLLVYVALANLRKRVPFGHLSIGLRLDVKEFFGNYTRALEKGLELLYAAGDSGEIDLACEDLKLGWQDEQALYVHRSLLEHLPPVLRAYVGCATLLFGDVAQADVIKLHKASGKVTFLVYDDFDGKPVPELKLRIKVNLRTRWVQVFDHSAEHQLCEDKLRYLNSG
jgi:hypothetical protein